jgi:DNA-binding YbaB/EbfC family protein
MSKFNPLSSIMEQAQALQERLSRMQEESAARTVEASSGGGMVTCKMSGRLELLSLRIEPEALKSGDAEMIQDLVIAAVNQAIRQAQDLMSEEMKQLTGGFKIPGLS